MKKRDNAPSNRSTTMAQQADPHQLYLASVQDPLNEVQFFNRVYRKHFSRSPQRLREDFCGTAAVCYQWVKGSAKRSAVGVDIDPSPLDWGREHLAAKLSAKAQQRVELKQTDVREVDDQKSDIVSAQNFSFWVFKTRDELRKYFQAAYDNLQNNGLFILDMMGGPEIYQDDTEEVSAKEGFDYVWQQHQFDPITHDCHFSISFRFDDDSELPQAFNYHWRLWSIVEVREVLEEVGFATVDTYWEGTDDETGEGDGQFRVQRSAPADQAWIAYMVAAKTSA